MPEDPRGQAETVHQERPEPGVPDVPPPENGDAHPGSDEHKRPGAHVGRDSVDHAQGAEETHHDDGGKEHQVQHGDEAVPPAKFIPANSQLHTYQLLGKDKNMVREQANRYGRRWQ